MIAISASDIASSVRQLPALPQVVMELVASLNDENCDLDHIARQIARDPAMAAKTLRLANSSFYGLSRQIQSIDQAIAVLGFHTVRNIATTTGLVRGASALANESQDLKPFWRHCMSTALCARELAALVQVSPTLAYTCGLLHDVGKLLLMTQFTAAWSALHQSPAYQPHASVQTERAQLGLDHAEVGRLMAQQWQFPLELQEAIALHHSNAAEDAPLCQVVALANRVVHALQAPDAEAQMRQVLACGHWLRMALEEEYLARLVQKVQGDLAGMELLLN